MQKTKLSVVLATHNEAENLERCLSSVEKVADEVIVVDGESIDETVKIAKKLGARVIETTNKPIFHINKQMAIGAATNGLILQLDADEVVDQEMLEFLQELKKQTSFEYSAWWLRRKNLFIWRWLKKPIFH